MTEILTNRGISWRSVAWDKKIASEFVKGLRGNLTQFQFLIVSVPNRKLWGVRVRCVM